MFNTPARHGSDVTPRVAIAAPVIALLLSFALAGVAFAADPSPVLIDPLDPRGGENAGGMGSPLVAAIAVVAIGALAAGAAALYVRVTRTR